MAEAHVGDIMAWIVKYRSVIGLLLALISFVGLLGAIIKLTGFLGSRRQITLPLKSSQSVRFEKSGKYLLFVEAPRFSNISHLKFRLEEEGTGEEILLRFSLFRIKSSGLTDVKLELRNFRVPRLGTYRLEIAGIESLKASDEVRVIVSEPYGLGLILRIVAIIMAGIVFVGSSVLLLIRLENA